MDENNLFIFWHNYPLILLPNNSHGHVYTRNHNCPRLCNPVQSFLIIVSQAFRLTHILSFLFLPY